MLRRTLLCTISCWDWIQFTNLLSNKIIKEISRKQGTKKNKYEKSEKENEILVNWNEAILYEEFEMKTEHLDMDIRKIIYNLVDKHGALFAKHQFDVGTVKDHKACIKLSEDKYVVKKLYQCSIDNQIETERQVAELLKHSMIEESCSPFAAPVSLAYKKNW